jgi:hypothetical protein
VLTVVGEILQIFRWRQDGDRGALEQGLQHQVCEDGKSTDALFKLEKNSIFVTHAILRWGKMRGMEIHQFLLQVSSGHEWNLMW